MGQFLKQTFASLIGSLLALLLLVALGASGLALFFVSTVFREDAVKIKDKTVLVFDLSTPISDTKPPSGLGDALSGQEPSPMTLRQVLDSIEKATEDEQIVGLFLDGRRTQSEQGYALLTEIRGALEEFRAAGKEVVAYDVSWEEPDYYLSSVADQVVLNPMGTMTINGFSTQTLFLEGALKKYGVGVQVIRAGNYKSFGEPFTRQSLSPESREQTEALLADLWQEFLGKVAASRELTVQQVQAIADRGFLDAETARSVGLVDRVAYFDEVVADLKALTDVTEDDQSFRQLSLSEYTKVPGSTDSENKIAVVYAEGTIVSGEGVFGQVGSDRFVKILRQLQQDNAVKAVVLRINSPGGEATASDIIWREVQLVRETKPVVISMGNVAASGGYWIATGGDAIFAQANTITGSIGVVGILPNVQELANEQGITWDVVKTGQFADTETITRPKTPQELAILQKYVNQTYGVFLEKVAQSRKLSKDQVDKIAQGRVWSGEDAKQIGLVDQLGGLDAAIAYAAQKAKLGDNWETTEYPQQPRIGEIFERLVDRQVNANLDPLTAEFLKFKDDLALFQSLSDPRGVYARLLFNLRID